MKHLFTVTLLAFSIIGLTAQAKPAKGQSKKAPAVAVPAPVAEFNKSLDIFCELATTLTNFRDRAAADAAVPKLKAQKSALDNGEADIDEAMKYLSDDEQKATVMRLLNALAVADKQMKRLEEEAYYGSPTLAEFLTVDLPQCLE